MKKEEEKKLRLIIENILQEEIFKEQEEQAGFGQLMQDPLVATFVQPFTDVLQTAKAGAEKITASAFNNIGSLAKQTAVLAVPFLATSMIDDIDKASKEKLQQRLSQINDKYADVLQRNFDTMRTTDVWGLTFLLNPAMGLGKKAVSKAPGAALGTLEVLTGGNPKVAELRQQAQKLGVNVFPPEVGGGGGVGTGGGMGGGGMGAELGAAMFGGDGGGAGGESVHRHDKPFLREQEQDLSSEQKKALAEKVLQLVQSPAVKKDMYGSEVSQQMRQAAIDSVQEVLQPVMKANSYDDLKNAIGEDFKQFEDKVLEQMPEDATDEQIQELKEEMVPHIKEAYKDMLVKRLQDTVKDDPTVSKEMQELIKQLK